MRPCGAIALLIVMQIGLGCAFISDDHAAWREDPDKDGVAFTEDCDETDSRAGAPQMWFADADADGFGDSYTFKKSCIQPEGFVALDGDCNDLDPRIRPGAKDRCNWVDDDCDGQTDEDAQNQSFFMDEDGDGFGDPDQKVRACSAPTGMVSDNTDCDDGCADCFPENPEVCDAQDNDCNGAVDDAVAELPQWFADSDGDSFGDPDVSIADCTQPDGYVGNSDDCDDADEAWLTEGPEEVTFNGIEDNCDLFDGDGDGDGDGYWHEDYLSIMADAGLTPMPIPEGRGGDCNDADPTVNPGAIELPDSGEDKNCDGVVNPDVDDDGFDSILAGGTDCDDTDPLVHPGAEETCSTSYDDDCDGEANEVDAPGCDLYFPDVDGDGFGLTGEALCLCLPEAPYEVEVGGDCDDADPAIFLGAEETCFDDIDSDCDGAVDHAACGPDDMAVVNLFGESDEDVAGVALSHTVDGSLIIGALGYDNGGITDAGAVYVLPTDDVEGLTLGGAGMRVMGSVDSALLGTAVQALSDGRIAMSAPGDGDSGIVYLITPSGSSSEEVWDIATTRVEDSLNSDVFGIDLTTGQLLGDGRDMLVIGAPGNDFSAAWVVDPSISGSIGVSEALGGVTSSEWDELGSAVATADVDGSGIDDLIIGIPDYQTPGTSAAQGAFAVVEGPFLGGFLEVDGLANLMMVGPSAYDRFGGELVVLGDVDGDGRADLLVGAERAGLTMEGDDPGAAYIVTDAGTGWPDTRTVSPWATLWGEIAGDWASAKMLAQDVNGDGAVDLWISAYSSDVVELDSGTVYLVLGPLSSGSMELVDDADLILHGEEAGASFGYGLGSAGDVDEDGLDDVLIGAPGASGVSGHVLVIQGADLPL